LKNSPFINFSITRRAGVYLEEGWPCSGPLLRLAEDAGQSIFVYLNGVRIKWIWVASQIRRKPISFKRRLKSWNIEYNFKWNQPYL